jgi:tRNA-dihydrouridine synthase
LQPKFTLKELILKQIDMTASKYGDNRSAVILRKQLAYYLKGVKNSKKLKQEIFTINSAEKMKQLFIDSNIF